MNDSLLVKRLETMIKYHNDHVKNPVTDEDIGYHKALSDIGEELDDWKHQRTINNLNYQGSVTNV
jgi:hypothetical protein